MRRVLPWLLPGGGVVALVAGALAWAPAPWLSEAARGYPWVAFALTFALAALFHRTRPASLALALAGAGWALGGGLEGMVPQAVLGSTLALLVALLALTRDRGIGAPAGLAQLAFTVLLGGAGITAALAPPDAVVTLFTRPSFPAGLTAWTGVPEMTAFLWAGAGVAAAYGAWRRGGPVERALPWFLAAVFLAVHGGGDATARLLWLLGASLVLSLSVVETSYAMAYRDDLTGLPARRALMRDLEGLSPPYTAAMVDVDHFKKFNDRHGHDVGDQVLRMVAGRLARVRGGGRSYRYGGEEFTVLFPGRAPGEAMPHLERLRADVEAAAFSLRSWSRPATRPEKPSRSEAKRLSVTVSIGVAGVPAGGKASSRDDAEAVLKRADKALYKAKRAGRNRVST